MMHAVIKTGGKQYRVKEGDLLKVESLNNEVGTHIEFNEVLLISDDELAICGTPFVKGAMVQAEIIEHARRKKIRIIKFRRRKHHMKQMGHRQNYTAIKIIAISK